MESGSSVAWHSRLFTQLFTLATYLVPKSEERVGASFWGLLFYILYAILNARQSRAAWSPFLEGQMRERS